MDSLDRLWQRSFPPDDRAQRPAPPARPGWTFRVLVILAAAMVSTFLSIRITLDPLTKLTAAASEFADGKLDNQIEAKSNDEIGQIADVLERLRVSLKTAMDRLAKKT